MAYRKMHPPLEPFEKALIDAFCILRPCQPVRALHLQNPRDGAENREGFYAACRVVCTDVHFCPLEGGVRYMGFVKPARPGRSDVAVALIPSPKKRPLPAVMQPMVRSTRL